MSGTWVGTLIVEGSNDNNTYYLIDVTNRSTRLIVASITANSSFQANTNGWQFLRLRSSAWTSGTANISVYGSDAASLVSTDTLLRGGTNGTVIGNTSDSLKTAVTSSALPTGASTSALQTTGNTSLSSIDTKIPSGLTVTASRLQVELPPGGTGLTDTELRASPVPVSGTVAATQSTSPWVVSAASLPLPSGAATAANQATEIASLSSIDSKLTSPLAVTGPLTDVQLRNSPVPVSGTVAATQSGTWNIGALTSITNPVAVTGTFWQTTQPVSGTVAVTQSTSPWVVSGAVTANAGTNLNTSALALESTQASQSVLLGAVTETAPASDTASSGLNGRLQRIAQRLTSLIALIPSAIGTAFFTRISDGTDTAKVTTNQDLSISDGLRNGGVQGALSLATANTAYEAKVGGSRLAQRKSLTITANDDMFWGYSNAVTTANGTPLKKNQQIAFAIDPDSTFQVWVVASASSKTARITESP